MKELFFYVIVFFVLVVLSALNHEWTAMVIALFAQFYFTNEMRKERK
jgi:hypothetical protein